MAEKAGVSIATVSRVINGASNVNNDMKEVVLQTIRDLEFIPNQAAQSMKLRRYNTIGLVVVDFSHPFFAEITKQIEIDCRKNGNLVLFVNTYDDPVIERQGIEYMVQHQVNVIVIASTGQNEDYIAKLCERGISFIFLDRRPHDSWFSSIYIDKRKGMYDIMDYLAYNHHRKIALISGLESMMNNVDRVEGVKDFCKEYGDNKMDVRYFFGNFTTEQGAAVVGNFFQEDAQWTPTAIVTGNACMASGVLLYCKEHGIAIPYQLSLISCEDLSFSQLIEPYLTFMDGDYSKISAELIEMIQSALDGTLESISYVIEPHLVVRNSVKMLLEEQNITKGN